MSELINLEGSKLGAFVLRERIGQGSFGLVFRAEQPVLKRDAVVKVALRQQDSTQVDKFLREAQLASRLEHPYAAHIYDFGAESNGLWWIAMEFIRGSTLAQMLETGILSEKRAVPLLVRLCEVVQAAHDVGIIHRDIKPDNVMVLVKGGALLPKLLDLGVARDAYTAESEAAAGPEVAGTPLYMAPEQWVKGAPITPATDVYALGVLAYEILTGKPPFMAETARELAMQHARTPAPRVEAVSEAVASAIAKALEKRPSNRFASAADFARALQDASGLTGVALDLPSLDQLTRDEVLTSAPQPLAESIATLEASRSPVELRAALWLASTTLCQVLGNLALAARQRTMGRHGETPEVASLLTTLTSSSLTAQQWLTLCKELVRPFAGKAALYPVPELVELFFADTTEIRSALEILLASRKDDPGANGSAEDIRAYLVGAINTFGLALRSMQFLHQYRLAVAHEGVAYEWTGLRRQARVRLACEPELEGVVLITTDGALVCDLSSVITVAEPSPGAAPEMFFLVGGSKGIARGMALPGQLELRREDVWKQLGIAASQATASDGTSDPSEKAPYLGLATFSADDANLYFGRETEVFGFVNRMQGRRFIAIVGPSGSGKSSFVQAGVLPNLPVPHRIVLFRPGSRPIEALQQALAKEGLSLDELLRKPQPSLAMGEPNEEANGILLVVDQFEELITQCLAPDEREKFANTLMRAANQEHGKISVIVTLRDDFLIRAAQISALRTRLAASLHLVTTPVEDDLKRILTEPARRSGYSFEDQALVEEIAREVAQQSAALALLSFTAYQLWQYRDRHFRKLTRKAYRALGGVGGALAHHAESIVGGLSEDENKAVREIFRHLVTAEGTRASMSRAELLQVSGSADADAVLEKLIGARLLVAQDSDDGSERIEVIHEALLEAWPRLVRWRQEDAEGARLRDQLRVAAKQWRDRNNDKGLLWRGDTLAAYRVWRARYPGSLTDLEQEFATASLREAERTKRIRQVVLGVVGTALLITTIVFAGLRSQAVASQREAKTSEARVFQQLTDSYVDQGRRAVLANNELTALIYFYNALARGTTDPTVPFMMSRAVTGLRALAGTLEHPSAAGLRYAPGGKHFLTWGGGLVRVWQSADQTLAHERATSDSKTPVVWAGPTRLMNINGTTGEPELVDIASGQVVQTLHMGHRANSVSWNLKRSVGFFTSTTGSVYLWDPTASSPLLLDRPIGSWTITAISAPEFDGALLYGYSADFSKSYAALVLGTRHVRLPSAAPVIGGQFSPDGSRIALLSIDGRIQVFDTKDTKRIHDLPGVGDARSLAFSADGMRLAAGMMDGSIKVFSLQQAAIPPILLTRHEASVNALMFLRNDEYIASASNDGVIKIWSVAGPPLMVSQFLHDGPVGTLESPAVDPNTLLSASSSGTVRLWRLDPLKWTRAYSAPSPYPQFTSATKHSLLVAQPTTILAIDRHDGKVASLPDEPGSYRASPFRQGSAVVVLSADGSVAEHSERLAFQRHLLPASKQRAEAATLAADPAGTKFVVSANSSILLYNAEGREIGRASLKATAGRVQWSRGGERILVFEGDFWGPNELVVLSGTDLSLIGRLPDSYGDAWFSPRGNWVVTKPGPNASIASVWRADGTRAFTAREPSLFASAAFDPNEDYLLLGSHMADTAGVWSLATQKRVGEFGERTSGVLAMAITEDGRYAYLLSANSLSAWDLATRRQVWRSIARPEMTELVANGSQLIAGSFMGSFDVFDVGIHVATLNDLAVWICLIPSSVYQATPFGAPPPSCADRAQVD